MSKVKIQGNASGTGVVTLTAPNTNTDRTITLPDGDISLGVGIDDNATSTAITLTDSNTTFSGDIKVDNGAVSSVVSTGTAAGVMQISGGGTVIGTSSFDLIQNGVGSHVWARNSEPLMFATGGTERMRILSTGGLTFNGDTAAANALDDYETGTWTPTLGGGTTTYITQAGVYTKVGDLVSLGFEIHINLIGTGNTSTMEGLPFSAIAPLRNGFTPGYFADLATSIVTLAGYTSGAGHRFRCQTGANVTTTTTTVFKDSARVVGTIIYQTA